LDSAVTWPGCQPSLGRFHGVFDGLGFDGGQDGVGRGGRLEVGESVLDELILTQLVAAQLGLLFS
jgi:hypothetical protein